VAKERIFQKKVVIDNFRVVRRDQLKLDDLSGRAVKEIAEIIAEVYYTPKGYRTELHFISPLVIWDFEQMCKLNGVSDKNPDGDLSEKNFSTELSAMHFLTKRLGKLGWKPTDGWRDE